MRRRLIFYLAAILSCALWSCTKEPPGPELSDENTVTLCFYEPSVLSTKSSIDAQENTIKDCNIFAYCDGRLFKSYYLSAQGSGGYIIRLAPGRDYSLYAVCNTGKELDAPEYSEDIPQMRLSVSSIQDFSTTGFPMASAQPVSFYMKTGNNTVDIPVERVVSKINIKIDRSGLRKGSVTVKSLRLCNAALDYTPFRERSSASMVSEGDRSSEADVHNLNIGSSAYFYVLENCQGTLLDNPTSDPRLKIYDNLPVESRDYCTYIEMECQYSADGGYVKSENLRYRLYLGANTYNNFDIFRNTVRTATLKLTDEGLGWGNWMIDTGDIVDSRALSFRENTLRIEGPGTGTLEVQSLPDNLQHSISVDEDALRSVGGSYNVNGKTISFSIPDKVQKTTAIPVTVTSWDNALTSVATVYAMASYSVSLSPERAVLYYGSSADFEVVTSDNVTSWAHGFDVNTYLTSSVKDDRITVTNGNDTGVDIQRLLTVITDADSTASATIILKAKQSIDISKDNLSLRYLQGENITVSAFPASQVWTCETEGPIEVHRDGTTLRVVNNNDGNENTTAKIYVYTEDKTVKKVVSITCWRNQTAAMDLSATDIYYGETVSVSVTSDENVSISFRNTEGGTVERAVLPTIYGLSLSETGNKSTPVTLTYDKTKLEKDIMLTIVGTLPDGSEVTRDLTVHKYAEDITITPASGEIAYKDDITFDVVSVPAEGWTYAFESATELAGIEKKGSQLVVTSLNDTETDKSVTVIVWSPEKKKSAKATVRLISGKGETTYEYDTPVLAVFCNDVPASGGSVTKGTKVAWTQDYRSVTKYTDGSEKKGDTQHGSGEADLSTVTWSRGAENIAPKPAEESARTSTGKYLKAEVKINGVQGEGQVEVYQEANIKTETTYEIDDITLTPSSVGADGGAVTITGGKGYKIDTYASGTRNKTEETVTKTITANSSNETFKASLAGQKVSVPSLGTTVVSEGGYSVIYTLKTATPKSAIITQAANKVESTAVKENSLTFDLGAVADIPASGGDSKAPAVSNVKYTNVTEYTYTSGKTKEVSSGGTSYGNYDVCYSKDGQSFSGSFSAFSGSNLNTAETPRTKLGTQYVKVKDKSSTAESVRQTDVYQEANTKTKISEGGNTVKSYAIVLTPTSVGGTGGTVTVSGKQTIEVSYPRYSFTSGAYDQKASETKEESKNPSKVSVSPTTGVSVSGSTIKVEANYGAARNWTVTGSVDGLSGSASLSQDEGSDTVTSSEYTIGAITASPASVGAAGGRVNISGGKVTATRHYASGKTDMVEVGNATLSVSRHSVNSAFAASLSGATVIVPTLGKTEVAAGGYTVTATYSNGGVSAVPVSCTIGQSANIRTKTTDGSSSVTDYTISLNPASVTSAGGKVTVTGKKTVKTTYPRYTYSSGETEQQSETSETSDQAPASVSVNPTTGVSVSGTTVTVDVNYGSARSWTVSGSYNGRSATATLSQTEGSDKILSTSYTIGDISVSPTSFSAAGGSSTISGGDVTAHYTYASGKSEDKTIGKATFSLSPHSRNGSIKGGITGTTVTIPSLGTVELSEGSYTVTAAYESAQSKTTTIRQSANSKTLKERISAYGTPTVSIGSGITASGGSATVTASVTNTKETYYEYSSGAKTTPVSTSIAGEVSLSLVNNGNNRFHLSGTTLSHDSMTSNAVTDAATVRATNSGDSIKYKDASVSVTNAVTNTEYSISAITPARYASADDPCPASGGTTAINGGEGVITYTYTTGSKGYGSFTPNKSVSVHSNNGAFAGSINGDIVTIPSLGSANVPAGHYVVTYSYSGAASKTCNIYQAVTTSAPGLNGEISEWGKGNSMGDK